MVQNTTKFYSARVPRRFMKLPGLRLLQDLGFRCIDKFVDVYLVRPERFVVMSSGAEISTDRKRSLSAFDPC